MKCSQCLTQDATGFIRIGNVYFAVCDSDKCLKKLM